jgi:Zn-dependent protease with chaperone function
LSFLERQESARLRTRLYTLQFALLSVPCVAATFFATMCSVWLIVTGVIAKFLEWTIGERDMDRVISHPVYVLTSGVICTVLVLWVLVWKKRRQLNRSGEYVAAQLGADLITHATRDLGSRRLFNICEEMALAAGVEPPDIYLWPRRHAINALTVGHSTSDAAIFVTSGAVEVLTRDELQAIVGHAMSQVLNGDMALNSRLAVYLYAFNFAPRVAKWWLLFPFDRKGVDFLKALFAWLFFIGWVGVALSIITFPGYLAARLMQVAIGRERQKLADASAVQFTRNAPALESTLTKALAMGTERGLVVPVLVDLAHGCFAAPLKHRILATHPPLEQRIRTLNPKFDAKDVEGLKRRTLEAIDQREVEKHTQRKREAAADSAAQERRSLVQRVAAAATIAAAGAPRAQGGQSRDDAPLGALVASGDPRAVLLALLIERKPEIQNLQLEVVRRHFGEGAMLAMAQSLRALRPLSSRERTLALDTHLPALRALRDTELRRLQATLIELEATDDATDVFEYAIARRAGVFISDLLAPREPHGNHVLGERGVALGAVLSILAQHGGKPQVAAAAFSAGVRPLGLAPPPQYVPSMQWTRTLDRALTALETLRPVDKGRLIEAMSVTVKFDQMETLGEAELVRTIAASLHCPLPRAA